MMRLSQSGRNWMIIRQTGFGFHSIFPHGQGEYVRRLIESVWFHLAAAGKFALVQRVSSELAMCRVVLEMTLGSLPRNLTAIFQVLNSYMKSSNIRTFFPIFAKVSLDRCRDGWKGCPRWLLVGSAEWRLPYQAWWIETISRITCCVFIFTPYAISRPAPAVYGVDEVKAIPTRTQRAPHRTPSGFRSKQPSWPLSHTRQMCRHSQSETPEVEKSMSQLRSALSPPRCVTAIPADHRLYHKYQHFWGWVIVARMF